MSLTHAKYGKLASKHRTHSRNLRQVLHVPKHSGSCECICWTACRVDSRSSCKRTWCGAANLKCIGATCNEEKEESLHRHSYFLESCETHLSSPAEEWPLAEGCRLGSGSLGALLLSVAYADSCFCQAATCAEMPCLGIGSEQFWPGVPQHTADMADIFKASHTAALLGVPAELVVNVLPFLTGSSGLLHAMFCVCKG